LLPPSWRSFCSSKRFFSVHQFVPAHLLDGGLVFRAEFEFQRLAQPVQRHILGEVGEQFDALEVRTESTVELVELRLVLDERGAGQVVEVVHRLADDAGLQRFQQRQVLLDRDLQLGGAQGVEEVDEHGRALWRLNPRIVAARALHLAL